MPGVIWPDVEAYLVGYLADTLAARPEAVASGVRVSTGQNTASKQVIVRDDGGPRLGDVRATARVGVRVLTPTWEQCADLAALVVALLGNLPEARRGEVVVAVANLSRGYPVADPSGGPERYLTAELVVRGTTL